MRRAGQFCTDLFSYSTLFGRFFHEGALLLPKRLWLISFLMWLGQAAFRLL